MTESAVPLTLLLVDDHAMLREGLRSLIEMDSGFRVVGEAGSCDEAIVKIREFQPDVILCDIGLPGRSGISAIADVRRFSPRSRIILLTAHSSEEYIRAALDARADGYVLKDAGHGELVEAIRTVALGQPYLCRVVADAVLSSYMGRGPDRDRGSSPLQRITLRERQVLSRIAAGHSNKTVARELELSVKTVEKHRANMMRKLGLHNAADIARFALNAGLVG